MKHALLRIVAFVVPLGLGVLGFQLLVGNKAAPEAAAESERARPVRTLTLEAQAVTPRIRGYGNVQAAKTWQAVSQVSGRVIRMDERLEVGGLLEATTELFAIDRRPYENAANELKASLEEVDAQLAELAVKERNTRASLEIEQAALDASTRQLNRLQGLLETKRVTRTEVDQQETITRGQEVRVQELKNSLELMPTQRRAREATRKSIIARQASAALDLENTVIEAPFDCRVSAVSAQLQQFVGVGQVLAELHDLRVAEIVARVPIQGMRPLISREENGELVSRLMKPDLLEQVGLRATVRLPLGQGMRPTWEARVDRIEATLDAQTRTIGVVVAVADSYKRSKPGARPPLLPGMYCEVELRGSPKADRILIPRNALHGRTVYVVDKNKRLRRREIVTDFPLEDHVCVREGLTAGDQIVLTDLMPAIEGMLLSPQPDEAAARARDEAAAGKAVAKAAPR